MPHHSQRVEAITRGRFAEKESRATVARCTSRCEYRPFPDGDLIGTSTVHMREYGGSPLQRRTVPGTGFGFQGFWRDHGNELGGDDTELLERGRHLFAALDIANLTSALF
jgi:hypothetical protein